MDQVHKPVSLIALMNIFIDRPQISEDAVQIIQNYVFVNYTSPVKYELVDE